MSFLTIDFLKEIAIENELDLFSIIESFKQAICQLYKSKEILIEVNKNGEILIEEIIRFKYDFLKKQLNIDSKKLKKLKNIFIENIKIERNKSIINSIKNNKNIVYGEVFAIEKNVIKVNTKYGIGFCFKRNLYIKDLNMLKIKIGQKLYFHIHKYRKTKNGIELFLDRKHDNIVLKEAQEILKDCGVYDAKKIVGDKVLIYCMYKPKKTQIAKLAKLANERIQIELRR
ncbi:Uncharacterised protein [Campylobacter insulaenigrae]|uniref:hypothetical protein n=1 Tax=Campylobacter insulaenigrae TaxID=260714 RepID=UPI000F71BCF5|nr:hypothetical protein [Campylobacter insulaenigrae]MCR6590516.1 hypothetical protein [Campylobacter insulaenigrae]MCR6592053.1 hypothetical protein [Campylobacter insulaenigrae]VEJ53343.1 Uncharacterised protein [Campylobacter insulaenigrae]